MFTLTIHTAEHAQLLFDTIHEALLATPIDYSSTENNNRRAMLADLLIAAHSPLAAAKSAQS